ncbi:MAG TPA: superoxide dismutase [Chryseolinea sp.]
MKTTRRKFIENSFKATAIVVGSPMIAAAANSSVLNASGRSLTALQFSQVALPYAYNALEPSIDATTMDIHYNKHHTAYIKNVNEAITADKLSFATEKEFFSNASKLSAKAKNNGGGAWNHNFFWQVMHPSKEMKTPTGKLGDAINGSFESFDKFKEQFTQAAMTRFGSGWAWLVNDNGKLKIGSTANQDNPLMDSSELKGTPLLGLDVWEHAYYLKYQNKRNEYVANWWNVVHWEEVAKRLA